MSRRGSVKMSFWDLQIVERKFKLEEGRSRLEMEKISMEKGRMETTIDMVTKAMVVMEAINGFKNIDDRTKVQFEDLIKNTMFKPSVTHVTTITSSTSGEKQQTVTVSNETASLNVSVKAREMGLTLSDKEAINIGKLMASKYR